MDAAQKVIHYLKEEAVPFSPAEVQKAVDVLGVEEDLELLTQRVMAEGARETAGALHRFFQALGTPCPDLSKVEAHLREGYEVSVRSRAKEGRPVVDVEVIDPRRRTLDFLRLPLPNPKPFAGLDLYAGAGLVALYDRDDFGIMGDRVFFKARSRKRLGEVLRTAKALEPFLPAVGLDGLPKALETLKGLSKGKSQIESSYILARGEDFWVMRKGPIFGDPELDGALLLEKELSLTFPGGVEITFKAYWFDIDMAALLPYVHLRLGEEGIYIEQPGTIRSVFRKDPITSLIRDLVTTEFKILEAQGSNAILDHLSPKTLAFLKAFAEHEDPFRALTEGRFHQWVTANLFAEL
jgi:hypothetical protein